MSNILQAARSGMSMCAHVHDRNGMVNIIIMPRVNTQGKCFSVRNTGSSEEKNYYHIRCSVTHCCCYCCFFWLLFCFFWLYYDNQIKLNLFQNCTEKKWMKHNIPIPKLIIRTTIKDVVLSQYLYMLSSLPARKWCKFKFTREFPLTKKTWTASEDNLFSCPF